MAHEWPTYRHPDFSITSQVIITSQGIIAVSIMDGDFKKIPSFICNRCPGPPCRCPSTLETIKRMERERKEKEAKEDKKMV